MAYDWNDDIADRAADEMVTAITAARDAGDFAAELTALSESMATPRKAALPVSDLVDLESGVHVSLLPSLDGEESAETRSTVRHEYAVGLCVECQCGRTDTTRQALLMDLSQRIANLFKLGTLKPNVPATWHRTRTMMRIDRERLKATDTFLSFRHLIYIGRAK
jgi:hypothetical protein